MSRLLLSPSQFILRGLSARQLRKVRWSCDCTNLRSSGGPTTLLHELFPEEAGAVGPHKLEVDHARCPMVQSKHIPRLPLDVERNRSGPLDPEKIRKRNSRVESENPRIAALFLRHAPKTLTEDDFRRLIPKGRHIPSWKLEGDILKVIPVRDPNTLMPLGHYYLLFSSMSSAGTYRAHVSRLHRLSKAYTPDNSSSPPAPPPCYLVDHVSGEDVYALLRDYAFVPPSQEMSLMFVKYPYPRSVQQLIDNGGYDRLGSQKSKLAKTVLFSIDGVQPSTHRVRIALSRDGRDRSLHWALSDGGRAIVRVDDRILDPAHGAWDEYAGIGHTGTVRPVKGAIGRQRPQLTDGKSTLELKKRTPTPWLVTLRDEPEAKRFVRAWNRRVFPMSNDESPSDESPSMVKAELVW